MKVVDILEGIQANAYFEVTGPFDVWVFQGTKASNHYYGSSRLHQPTYKKTQTSEGDQLHFLHGGLFYVPASSNQAVAARLSPPGEFSPFEKNYNPRDERSHQIEELIDDGYLYPIDKSEVKRVQYRT